MEKNDCEAIGSDQVRYYVLEKSDDGERTHRLEPLLKRPNGHRQAFKKRLEEHVESVEFKKLFEPTKEEEIELKKVIRSMKAELDEIPQKQIDYFERIADRVRNSQEADSVPKVVADIDEFIKIERSKHPNDVALDILASRMPDILEFCEEDRLIESPFNMTLFKHQKADQAKTPCNTLANLCEISGLDINTLKENLTANKPAKIAAQFENANRKLEELLHHPGRNLMLPYSFTGSARPFI